MDNVTFTSLFGIALMGLGFVIFVTTVLFWMYLKLKETGGVYGSGRIEPSERCSQCMRKLEST